MVLTYKMGKFKRKKQKKFKHKSRIITPISNHMLKTLIVFDTNSLRSTEAGAVAYTFFAFGRPFQTIEQFISDNNLTENIHIAIPSWAIEELKDQKNRQYLEDVKKYKEVTERLLGLPSFQKLPLPDEDFDCITFIQTKAEEYLATKEIKLLEIKEELANTVLQSMMQRVMKDQNKKQPFAHIGKYKDAGFKDNIVWESLMHFDQVIEFDKVIFITKDTDYSNCQNEFKAKWNKHFSLLSDENNAIVEIQKDYELYLKERALYEYTQRDYFISYLFDQLKIKSEIIIENENYKIENFEIVSLCKQIDRLPPDDDGEESIVIASEVKIFFKKNLEKKEQVVLARTTLLDEETKVIVETVLDYELL